MATQSIAVSKRYGRLMILELGERQGTVYLDRALCECGTVKTVRRADLQSGKVTSCGCVHREVATRIGAATRKHGHSRNPLYHLWHTMIAHCHNPPHTAYRYYGACGIQVCDRWRASFEAFAACVGARPVGLELDRIDPDGNYEPGNVRWTNRRRCRNSIASGVPTTTHRALSSGTGQPTPFPIWPRLLASAIRRCTCG